ncbi:TP53-binding protein 1 [Caerostris extrusa]|uniref:TP53-binding protein 1 n=1 Tax=Caerostris extrusa TaxID=172846 RepID=A0AAV4UVH3_CAEEX|nr:TP53-binding protein 1 [Caerostris extrusa]
MLKKLVLYASEVRQKHFNRLPFTKFEKHPKAVVGSFKNTESLQKIFDNFYGIFLEHECLDAMLSLKPNEELKVKKVLDFTVRNNKVYLEQSLEIGTQVIISAQ